MTGHPGHRGQRLLQPFAAPRDDQVDDALLAGQLGQLLAPAAGDERQSAPPAGRRPRRLRARRAASTAFERAADDDPRSTHRVARLQAQRGGVDRHVRPGLVDDRHDAERHADLAHLRGRSAKRRPSMTSPTGSGSATMSRTPRAIAATRPVVEGEAVHERRRQARLAARPRGRARWPRGSRRARLLECVGDGEQRRVLGGGVEGGQLAGRRLGGEAELGDGLGGDGHAKSLRRPAIGLVAGVRRARSSRGARPPRWRAASPRAPAALLSPITRRSSPAV